MKLHFLVPKVNLSRLDYTIEFLAQTLGYPYSCVTSLKNLNKNEVIVSYLSSDAFLQHYNHPILNIFNSQQMYQLDEFEQTINLFRWKDTAIPILGRQLTQREKEQKRAQSDKKYLAINDTFWTTQIDIFANIFYHLSRYEEKWRHFAEETVSDYSTSVLSRYQNLTVPVVDLLVDYFNELIRQRVLYNGTNLVRVLPWPNGEELGLALTHDVDLTRAVSIKKRITAAGKSLFLQLSGKGYKKRELWKEIHSQDARVWAFPKILKFYHKKGWHATFFFLAKRVEGFHYRYNIKAKKYMSLINELREDGHEVALHSSLKAFDQPKMYTLERKKLEAITSTPCLGVRQHYLRVKYPRFWKIAQSAGFRYDASLGYNFQPGFRAGTSHPFYTYDFNEDKKLEILEFPLTFFEHNLKNRQENKMNPEELISELIKQVSIYNGLCMVLLHPSNYLHPPYDKWWDFTIQCLEKQQIAVATLSGHYHWLTQRKQIRFDFDKKEEARSRITVVKPADLKLFSIEIVGKGKLLSDKDIIYTEKKGGFYTLSTPKSRFSISLNSPGS